MAVAVRRVGHREPLGIVDHLDELRTRLIVSLAVLVAAFAVCMWQNHELLHLVNRPLASQTQKQLRAGHGPLGRVVRPYAASVTLGLPSSGRY